MSRLGEPSPPKLEGKLQTMGNALKVNWIKQDDGGSPIKHYLIRYRAVSMTGQGGNAVYTALLPGFPQKYDFQRIYYVSPLFDCTVMISVQQNAHRLMDIHMKN